MHRLLPLFLVLFLHAATALPGPITYFFAPLPEAPAGQVPSYNTASPPPAPSATEKFKSKYDEYSASLDAGTPEELITLVKAIQAQPDAPQAKTRLLYAPVSVTNKAFLTWNQGRPDIAPGHLACNNTASEALFATPPACMSKKLTPGNLPMHVGKLRPFMRRSPDTADTQKCIYTTVRCVAPASLANTVEDLLKKVATEVEANRDKAFVTQGIILGLNAIVNQAWRKSFPAAGLKDDEDVCKKVEELASSQIGAFYAQFPESEECRGKRTNAQGKVCKMFNVECL